MRNFKYILLFAPAFLIAQNNLFFNRVLNFGIAKNQTVTVPEGKAWNVVSGPVYPINDSPVYGSTLSGASMIGEANNWLGEGVSISNGTNALQIYSILEYDVIPISSSTTGSTSSTSGFTSTTDFVGSGQYTTTKDYTEADSFTDIDGNEYGAVNIDGAIWSTSNLRVTKFSDGTPIREATSWSDFNGAIEAMYYDANGDGSNVVYNWLAISGDHDFEYSTPRKNLAPEGYRVTSYFDWKRLLDKYGGERNAATFLLSKNFIRYPGLDKAGLNLMQTSHRVMSNEGQARAFYGTNTYSYTSSSALRFWGFRFIEETSAISYDANFESILFSYSSNSYYSDAVVVRVVKDDY